MNIWHKPYPYTQANDVIFKRHECEWIIPLAVAEKLKYNPMHVPAIIYHAYIMSDIRGSYVQIYEFSRFECEPYVTTYNKLVFTRYRGTCIDGEV